ncbi:MAG: aminopeptidase P family protein [Clostridia bacterium]|nr:aminopeptidase P family protein [Clostridia bacterium]
MLDKFISLLPEDIDGVMIVSPVNRFFFTDFESSDGILIAGKKGSAFFTDSRYIEAAQNKITCCEVRELKNTKEQLPAVLAELGIEKLGAEGDRLTVNELKSYCKTVEPVEIVCDGIDAIIDSVRNIKTEWQLQRIIKAQRIAESAFEHILGFIREGVTEKEIALELDYYMLKNGADALSFETIAVSGANTSKPHGVPTDKPVESGDYITMDFGAVVDGYHSDMTRTVSVGKISDEQRKVYSTVLRAQLAALEIIREGLPCRDADAAARKIITDEGYGEFFRHSTGHGVGVEIHEKPNLSPKAQTVLESGNIVTVEPGIYLPGKFGVRIEDMVMVTPDGCKNLTFADKNLISL